MLERVRQKTTVWDIELVSSPGRLNLLLTVHWVKQPCWFLSPWCFPRATTTTVLYFTSFPILLWDIKCLPLLGPGLRPLSFPCLLSLVTYLVTQLCPAVCDPLDCSPPGSSVHWVFLVTASRILEFAEELRWPCQRNCNCRLSKMTSCICSLVVKKIFSVCFLFHGVSIMSLFPEDLPTPFLINCSVLSKPHSWKTFLRGNSKDRKYWSWLNISPEMSGDCLGTGHL